MMFGDNPMSLISHRSQTNFKLTHYLKRPAVDTPLCA
jgi:hypothetical protein